MLAERLKTSMDAHALIQAHQAEIWRYLRYLGCEAAEAEDLTQETFLAALSGTAVELDGPRRSAYLRTVARNLFLKSKRRAVVSLDLDAAERVWTAFAREDGGASSLDALRSCVEALDGRAKKALELRYAARSSNAAMAASLDLAQEGVKTLLRRLKERLKDCVERKLAHDGP
jgi:RNA polymerase sigma-70 factor, ECF subfamily